MTVQMFCRLLAGAIIIIVAVLIDAASDDNRSDHG